MGPSKADQERDRGPVLPSMLLQVLYVRDSAGAVPSRDVPESTAAATHRREAGALKVGLGRVYVNLLVRAVEVARHHHRLAARLQALQEGCEGAVPAPHPVIQPLQALRVEGGGARRGEAGASEGGKWNQQAGNSV